MRPKSLFITSLILFVILVWFMMSTMDYDRSEWLASVTAFNTAGWFILGFPFFAAIGMAYAATITLIGQTGQAERLLAWAFMLVVTVPLIVWAAYSGLPTKRLVSAIGSEAAQIATLERLVVSDSFNEGTTTYGVITGPDILLDIIVRRWSLVLEPQSSLGTLRLLDEDDSLPEKGDVYKGKGTMLYRHPDTGKIYFRR